METPLSEIVGFLLTDIGQEDIAPEISDRCIIRALITINTDIDSDYQMVLKNDTKYIEPPLSPLHRELILLQAKMHFVKITRSLKEENISFKSGDKQVKRSTVHWKDVVKSLQYEYDRLLNREKPSANSKF